MYFSTRMVTATVGTVGCNGSCSRCWFSFMLFNDESCSFIWKPFIQIVTLLLVVLHTHANLG